ncbi:putative zinc finger protein 702 [Acyrthosiphon pisum]|uniref:C2H2-type domain-containing protein n=1 Tax=Acyrthosiphon pisum TaxID=7029 RepID=A0A8R2A994_ACYPI|nr:putative zinc finger protein 702 [Acyrthosiphon pisum]|eukprot:XP_003248216.1 PREDICTED: gastrula zinc finger protein XlCGF49.1 [Acyrthosiphon pisum]
MPSTTRSKTLNRRTTDKENHYTCNACGKSFTKKYKIAIHCQLHFGENPCRNKVYEEIMPSTTRSKTLNRRTTDKENHYTCNACGKSFTKKYKIAIHCQLHFGENPCRNKALAGEVTKTKQKCFICDVCHATFKEKHHVARHCKIHTGDKPYKCTICGKFFRDQSNLMTHKCIHTVEKRFQCTQCGKKFMKNDNLLVHYRTHSHEKPYKCDVCKKSFSTSGNLSRHKLTEPKRLERVFGYFAF